MTTSAKLIVDDERQWTRDIRSASLRGAVLLILFGNLILGSDHDNFTAHLTVVMGYLVVSLLSLGMTINRRGPVWAETVFAAVDALLVVIVLYEHLFSIDVSEDHGLTTPSLAIAFLLLNHVGLRLKPQLVVLFGSGTHGVVVLAVSDDRPPLVKRHRHPIYPILQRRFRIGRSGCLRCYGSVPVDP